MCIRKTGRGRGKEEVVRGEGEGGEDEKVREKEGESVRGKEGRECPTCTTHLPPIFPL